MNTEEFNKLLNQRLLLTQQLLKKKGEEYASDKNRLHNFDEGSRITGKPPTDVLDGFMLKHYISYRDMLSAINDGKRFDLKYIEEKFGDIIVYFILQEIMIKNRYCL